MEKTGAGEKKEEPETRKHQGNTGKHMLHTEFSTDTGVF
jgi:hypothetical protein